MIAVDERLLMSLAWMCEQYLGTGKKDSLDHMCMGAGEDAVELLFEHGLVTNKERGAKWTDKGRALLDAAP